MKVALHDQDVHRATTSQLREYQTRNIEQLWFDFDAHSGHLKATLYKVANRLCLRPTQPSTLSETGNIMA